MSVSLMTMDIFSPWRHAWMRRILLSYNTTGSTNAAGTDYPSGDLQVFNNEFY